MVMSFTEIGTKVAIQVEEQARHDEIGFELVESEVLVT